MKNNKTDKLILFCTLAAALFGLVLVSSAVKSSESYTNIIVQSIGILIGTILMLILSNMDYEIFLGLNKVVFALYTLFLILVLIIGTGRSETGTMGWISLGPVNIQPSEFAKIGFILTFSYHLSVVGDKINKFKNIVLLLLHISVPLALILMQPDYGTAMVFMFITIAMLFYAGLKIRYFLAAAGLFGVSAPLLWFFVLDNFQKERIHVFLNPESSPMGAGYNVIQSKLAVGAGMFTGKGLFKGTQIQLGFLPGKHTDFIYAVAGEELGFIGCMLIILLLSVIIIRIILKASQVRKASGSYICIGVAAMFLFQAFENIGMSIGIMPVTGIPLPFFSYGGSSVLTSFISIGVVLSVLRRANNI